ncbi:hypothetical protein LVJ94_51680 [Pendulispora rubella]|uniref:Uncharacterized protein n=1 Tax=Pendulispora rubella TaxID=2741070 RepID=A0ABZ2L344_9BACT
MRLRLLIQINVAYVLAVGIYGIVIDEPYWRDVGHGPEVYDGLFWLGLLLNGPSGLLADWLSWLFVGRSEAHFVFQYLFWSVLVWVQWRLYFLAASWSSNRAGRPQLLNLFAVALAMLGAVAARKAWLFGHRPSGDFFIDRYFWFVRVVGVACSGLVLVACRYLTSAAPDCQSHKRRIT